MKLNLLERLLIIQNLPKKEINIITMRIVDDLGKELGVTEKDYKNFEIKMQEQLVLDDDGQVKLDEAGKPLTKPGGLKWNEKGSEEREFKVGEVAYKTVKNILAELNDATPPKLTLEYLSLCNKFEIGKEDTKGESDAVTEDKPKKVVK